MLKAKIDSGARTSAIHASHIHEYEKKGKQWVRFRVYQSSEFMYVDEPIVKYTIVRNSFGVSQKRPLVFMKIKIGENSWETKISLTERSEMLYPMLIGRNTLNKRYLIHPKRSFVLTNNINNNGHINSI